MSKAADKLQITGALNARTSAEIDRLAAQLADPGTFAEWRELCQTDAVYITALTRVTRTNRKDKENTK